MKPLFSKKNILLFVALFFFQIGLRFILPYETKVWEDHDIAVNLVSEGEMYYLNDGAKNHTFQFPVYTSFLALGYAVFGIHTAWGILLNMLVHALTFFLFIELFGFIIHHFFYGLKEKYKFYIVYGSALVFFFHPAVLFYTLFHIHPLSFNIFSLFLGLYFSFRLAFSPTGNNAVITGMIIGICMLDRATVLLTLIPAGIILLQKISFKELLSTFSLTVVFILLMISPWLARNYFTDGIIGFESSAAKNIWKGVLYQSEGGNYLLNGETYYAALSESELLSLGKMNPKEQQDFFRFKYNEIWKSDPGHVIKMFFVKLKNFWWFRKHAGEEWGSLKNYLFIYKLVYLLVIILLLRLWYNHFGKIFILMSFPIALSLLQSYFYVEMRHRVAIEPWLLFLAFVSFFILWDEYLAKMKNINE